MSIGKSLRFEVFARDGFVCQYCGQRPPDVVLEVDHIHPVSKGGADELINLITSCYDCNRGKRAKVLSEIAPRPDADLMLLRVQQEIAEANRYLLAKIERDEVIAKVRDYLEQMWSDQLGEIIPIIPVWDGWLKKYGPEELEFAINRCGQKVRFREMRESSSAWHMTQCAKYVSGVLRKRAEDAA